MKFGFHQQLYVFFLPLHYTSHHSASLKTHIKVANSNLVGAGYNIARGILRWQMHRSNPKERQSLASTHILTKEINISYTSSSNNHGGKLVDEVAVVALLGARLSWLTMLFKTLTASMTVIFLRCPPERGHAETSLVGIGSPISSCKVRNPGGAWLSGISSRLSSSSKLSATSSIAIGALSSAS